MAISVIICSHNPRADYLSRTLASLRRQSLCTGQWELLLVDNASAAPLRDRFDLSWHPAGRHVREDTVGLTAARCRGIRDAKGELLIFVDDDNVLAEDYLERASSVWRRHPELGAWGAGRIQPEFEAAPSKEVTPFLPRLALRSTDRPLWSNNPNDAACCPFGAGLCVTRDVAIGFVVLIHELGSDFLGRKAQGLNANEDDVFVWASIARGLGFGVFPDMRLTHLIAARRVSQDYIVRLLRDSRFSECLLYFLLCGIRPRPLSTRAVGRVLFALSGGVFAGRCRWAATVGEARASAYIQKHQLGTIDVGSPTGAFIAMPSDSSGRPRF